ncbi:Short-chain dehydrogenase/reductase [Melia azedarach]|uniref:Short-chain dehydrogenase/reductase n=1 Tax=Melia azedarach TaxID=155640 RepID=A0ACC1X345_MELAZ|nr:Short-chain dehydrogenase/reductase [Melia azedarach]
MNGGCSVSTCKRLEGKVAIITGGASGIGAAAAELFQENGARVVIADVQDEVGQALAEKLGENVCYFRCDVSNEDDIINLVDTAVAKYGKLDIMYNNAGVLGRMYGGLLDTPKSEVDRLIAVNTIGGFLGAKHAARVMIPQRKGCILFTASACTVIAGLSSPAYTVSKYGIIALVKSLAAELGQHGIRVNCISPYALATGMSTNNGLVDSAIVEAIMSEMGNLRGQVLKPEGIANAALYLASEEANYVSGLNLVVDGGYSVVNPTMAKTNPYQLIRSFRDGCRSLLHILFITIICLIRKFRK